MARVDVINVTKASFILLALDLVSGPEMLCSGSEIGLLEFEDNDDGSVIGVDDGDGAELCEMTELPPRFSLLLIHCKHVDVRV